MSDRRLRGVVRALRRRLVAIGASSAVSWGLAAAAVFLLLAAWLDLLWDLSPQARTAAAALAAAAGAALAGALVLRTARAARDEPLARRLDSAGATGGEVLTGLELDAAQERQDRRDFGSPGGLRAGLARMAVRRAAERAAAVPKAEAVPARLLVRSLGSLAAVVAAAGLLAVCLPGVARTQWNRFTSPFGDVPPYSLSELVVETGDVAVVYGREQEVRVAVRGEPVDRVDIVLLPEDGAEEAVPMFPDADGRWRAVLARVTSPATYYARAYRTRSPHYRITVITVPRIEEVRFRITPPEYTGVGPYEGPLPKDGIAGLAGTKVRVWAKSNRPLRGGRIVLTPAGGGSDAVGSATHHSELVKEWGQAPGRTHDSPGKPVAARSQSPFFHKLSPLTTDQLSMRPTGAEGREAVGDFEIDRDGRFELRVIDLEGQTSQESFSGSITLMADHRPFIRLMQPKEKSLATPSAALPVVIAAEDDYGISRLELFRSLNDSRALPMTVPLPKQAPRRAYETVYLPLERYGLVPGDVVRLFGRVEDNDPAGAKGAESTLVEVEIISQADFERLLRAREGAAVLMSKYREARRRMESLAEETEGLRKKMKDGAKEFPPEAAVREEARQQLRRLAKRLRDEAAEVRKSAAHKLPFDIDRNLSPHLEALAGVNEQLARELEELIDEAGLNNERLAKHLESMSNRLAGERKQFERRAMAPLEHLEKIFPLIADQARFIVIVLRQKDLAGRLASLKGRDNEDNPALKARMRDLEEEQRKLREDLGALLEEIEDHATALPDDRKLDALRETAREFVREVRASGAAEKMSEAEAALAEFSGTRAHERAQEAADILARFVKSCQGMAGDAGGCLVFQPSLGACLGDSVAQMLAAMGLGMGGGFGMGAGAGGGYSVQRAWGQNMGLYGNLPGLGSPFGEGSGHDGREAGGPGAQYGPQANPDGPSLVDAPAEGRAGGSGEGAVPVQYRRRVGLYFQRLAEELGQR